MRFAWLVAGVIAGLAGWLAMDFGAWWAAFPLALAAGLVLGRRGGSLGAGILAGLIPWAAPLLLSWFEGLPVGRAALILSAILRAEAAGVPALLLTVLTGALMGVAGAWLGSALRLAVAGSAARKSPAAAAPGEPGKSAAA